MPRSVGLAHVVRHTDGTYVGVWGNYLLRSAFQPIFAFSQGRLAPVAFEGLIRPMRGQEAVSPGIFFGLIPPIDRMHVETLSRTLHLLNAGRFLDPSVGVFVNFDPSVFVDRDLTAAALRDTRLVLHEAGIEPRRIVCEVTERGVSSEATLFAFVAALREHGFQIAVDDYGAENSDLRRIEGLRPDIVKFDGRWVTGLMNSGPGFALLAEMVGSFTSWGVRTVFEGLEEGFQIQLAERCGAHMVQGFAVGRPDIVPSVFPHAPEPAPAVADAGQMAPADDGSAAAAIETAHPPFGRRASPRP